MAKEGKRGQSPAAAALTAATKAAGEQEQEDTKEEAQEQQEDSSENEQKEQEPSGEPKASEEPETEPGSDGEHDAGVEQTAQLDEVVTKIANPVDNFSEPKLAEASIAEEPKSTQEEQPTLMPEEMDKPPAVGISGADQPEAADPIPKQDYIVLADQKMQVGFQLVTLKSGEILSDHAQIQQLLSEGAAIMPVTDDDLTVCPKCTHRFLNY